MSRSDSAGRQEHRHLAHVDGIRALAVLPVVLFHLLPSSCPGGFAGVDVFFVLSGFLVTGRVLEDVGAGGFSVAEFYHRRIRRILPAYTALILAVFATGCALFYSVPLVHLADAVVMSTWFAANLYFEKTATGYFAQDERTSPLLHLWSLGVEEQFYLVLPLLGAVAARRGRRVLGPLLATLWLVSFATAVLTVGEGRASRAFYLSQDRAWEILTGALLALAARSSGRVGPANPSPAASGAAALGLALLILPYVLLKSATPFPGLAALPSVLGATLLVWFGAAGPVARLLAASWAVAVGRASYSIYLWHWPVFVFWRYAAYDSVGFVGLVAMIVLSMVLAVASWRWIEEPPRRSSAWGRSTSFAFAACSMAVLTALGVACAFGRGWPDLLHPAANRFVRQDDRGEFVESFLRNTASRVGRWAGVRVRTWPALPEWAPGDGSRHLGVPGRADLLLVGDSHAGSLEYGLDDELQSRGLGADTFVLSAKLAFEAPGVLDWIGQHPGAKAVVLAQFWSSRAHDESTLAEGLRRFASEVARRGRRLYVVTDVPTWPVSTGDVRARMQIVRPGTVPPEWVGVQSEADLERLQGGVNRRLAEIARETGASVVPLREAFRRDRFFVAFDETQTPPVSLFVDTNHLSPAGSRRAAAFLLRNIEDGGALAAGRGS